MLCSNDCSVNLFELGILLFISGVKEWIRTCLQRNRHDERSLLVWDSFRAHLTESVKADLQRRKIDVAVIPGGLTPVLQPLRRKYLNSLPEILNQNIGWRYAMTSRACKECVWPVAIHVTDLS